MTHRRSPGTAIHVIKRVDERARVTGKDRHDVVLWDDASAAPVRENNVLGISPAAGDSHRVMDAARPELAVAWPYNKLLLRDRS